jgi:hypothetical protein
VQQFESEMTELLVEQWRGCSWEVVDLGARDFLNDMLVMPIDNHMRAELPLAEGVPPESTSVHGDIEPEC